MTGEMIDGDVDLRRQLHPPLEAAVRPADRQHDGRRTAASIGVPLAVGEVDQPDPGLEDGLRPAGRRQPPRASTPSARLRTGWSPRSSRPIRTSSPGSWPGTPRGADRGFCQFQSGMQRDFALAAIALADGPADAQHADAAAAEQTRRRPTPRTRSEKTRAAEEARARKPQPKDELPEEFVGQAIKHIVMHEVGHSLGLRHNFKASTMLKADQLNDTAITRAKGLVGSVMDYSPINIAPKGKKQGDYYSTTIGPYDYWAIEYAYKPVDGDEASELKKIAARAPEHDLVYAHRRGRRSSTTTPTSIAGTSAPTPASSARTGSRWPRELLKDLDARVVKDGDSWARTRRAFSILLEQWGDGATLASQYIGGQSVSRDHKADKDAHDPIVPVPGAKQRECLKFLVDAILSDKSFQFSPALLRRLGTERWMHWGTDGFDGPGVDISVLERILAIQKIVLSHCLELARPWPGSRTSSSRPIPDADPLRMEEVFRSLTDGIWSDLDHLRGPARTTRRRSSACRSIRRNLQREYLRRLSSMVLGNSRGPAGDLFAYVVFIRGGETSVPADARALARLHLKEIAGRIGKVLETTQPRRSTTPAGPTSKSAATGSPRSSRPISTSVSPERSNDRVRPR